MPMRLRLPSPAAAPPPALLLHLLVHKTHGPLVTSLLALSTTPDAPTPLAPATPGPLARVHKIHGPLIAGLMAVTITPNGTPTPAPPAAPLLPTPRVDASELVSIREARRHASALARARPCTAAAF